MLVAESLKQQAAGLVVADYADRQNVDPQVGEIVDGVGRASRHDAAFTMFQDQHRRFARDPGNLSENKFVSHQIAEHGDRDFRERLRRSSSAARFL